eukprot:TRINITY_DN11069_c0_g1_i2.p1 TRINITY_DN11069_c0_g1~~TRINITY_DN11069_c0_g1_i2.p1  ORF type:complete len:416 (-),score=75.46 TRINITY_DN11069_c0_g1_i2:167-1414(-)
MLTGDDANQAEDPGEPGQGPARGYLTYLATLTRKRRPRGSEQAQPMGRTFNYGTSSTTASSARDGADRAAVHIQAAIRRWLCRRKSQAMTTTGDPNAKQESAAMCEEWPAGPPEEVVPQSSCSLSTLLRELELRHPKAVRDESPETEVPPIEGSKSCDGLPLLQTEFADSEASTAHVMDDYVKPRHLAIPCGPLHFQIGGCGMDADSRHGSRRNSAESIYSIESSYGMLGTQEMRRRLETFQGVCRLDKDSRHGSRRNSAESIYSIESSYGMLGSPEMGRRLAAAWGLPGECNEPSNEVLEEAEDSKESSRTSSVEKKSPLERLREEARVLRQAIAIQKQLSAVSKSKRRHSAAAGVSSASSMLEASRRRSSRPKISTSSLALEERSGDDGPDVRRDAVLLVARHSERLSTASTG